jgi:Mn-dependent DtxR family transcriptional regulator
MRPASTETEQQEPFESPTAEMVRGPGRYLVAVYWETSATSGRVRTGDVSRRLDVAPASVTEMFAKLDEAGLVRYERRGGVEWTDRGERLARTLAWRQCVVETFFCDETSDPLDANVAYNLAYALPNAGIERLSERIRSPCSHACRALETGADTCLLTG